VSKELPCPALAEAWRDAPSEAGGSASVPANHRRSHPLPRRAVHLESEGEGPGQLDPLEDELANLEHWRSAQPHARRPTTNYRSNSWATKATPRNRERLTLCILSRVRRGRTCLKAGRSNASSRLSGERAEYDTLPCGIAAARSRCRWLMAKTGRAVITKPLPLMYSVAPRTPVLLAPRQG